MRADPVPRGNPLGGLPRLATRQALLEARLHRGAGGSWIEHARAWLAEAIGRAPDFGGPEVHWRAAGLGRPGVIAQLNWPRLGTRLAFGIETPIAHALVDRLLGFERADEESHLQITPVEWGILTHAIAEVLARSTVEPGALGPADLLLDRVGPTAFDPSGLGALVTLRWSVRIGPALGSIRLWVPESLVGLWLAAGPASSPDPGESAVTGPLGALGGDWRAEAGTTAFPVGPSRFRAGIVLPIAGAPLRGTPASPLGPIDLAIAGGGRRARFPAESVPGSGGRHLTLIGPLRNDPLPREALPVSLVPPTGPDLAPSSPTADVPVTLVVELGRIGLPLRQVADLKPGDVLELGRHAREPVELTSNGRLVARGELVQLDTELGVRISNVFL